MIKVITPLFFTITLLVGCSEAENPETETHEKKIAVFDFEKYNEAELEGLQLNEGEKWTVNDETDLGMKNINIMLSQFDGISFVHLGEAVKLELDQIIAQCTMKGEDHDQFHIVLHALLKESKALISGESKSDQHLINYVNAYYDCFDIADRPVTY